MTAASLGLAALMFGALALPPFLSQHEQGMHSIAAFSFVLLITVPLLIGAWGSWAPLLVLRTLATIEAVTYLVVLIVWPIAHADSPPLDGEMPWVLTIAALPAVCFAVVARGVVVWGYLALVGVLDGIITVVATPGPEALLRGVQEMLYSTSFSAIFVGLVMVGLQSAERLDELQAATTEKAARSAARLARERERARFDGLIHDGVISTLLVAARSDRLNDRVVAQAHDTLAQLEKLTSTARTPIPVGCDLLVTRVQQLAHSYPVEVFIERATDAGQLLVPADIAEALLAASGEALRNSVEHAAGPEESGGSSAQQIERAVVRQLEVRLSAGAVTISVRDDGVGFDESEVRPERLGVARSIRARMTEVRGGYAAIDTRVGQGTAVILGWVKA